MACAKQAAEAEQLGGKLLQLCRKKAPEKELLRVLEVRKLNSNIPLLRARFSTPLSDDASILRRPPPTDVNLYVLSFFTTIDANNNNNNNNSR